MAQFKRQKQLRASSLQGARSFSGTQPASLLGPAPGLLNPPISADIIQAARHLQGGEKQRVFTGIVTSLHDYFGVVDDEVFFQLSVVKGRIPQIGEKVLVKAVYNPSQSVPWNALKVQTLSNQPLLKPPTPLLHVASLGQKQGILGAQPQLLFQPHRIPPLFPQKPISLFQTSPSLHLGHLGRYSGRGPKGRQDSGRWDDFDSKKRKQRGNEPWGVKKPRHEPPQYRVQLASYTVNSPFCDAMEILRRYGSIQLPREFYDARLCWLDTFPLTQPLTLRHPSRIRVASSAEETPPVDERSSQDAQPGDANSTFSAKVLLLSSPGIEEFYRNGLLYVEDPSDQRENPEHPTKQIKFLLGKKADEAVLIGGEWSPSLDGADPATNPMALIHTAIRCTKVQTGLDLSSCSKWFRFAEFRYLREGSLAHQERTVVFLPDIWSCMPSLEEWEAVCKQKAEKAPPAVSEDKAEMEEGTEQASEAGPEQEAEASEQEADLNEPASESTLETPGPELEAPTAPLEPALIAHSQPSCTNISLFTLLEYRRQREKLSFEVAVVAEFFQEMLQRDFGYKLYKALLALPEKEEPLEAKIPELEKAAELEKEGESEPKEEPLEKPGVEDTLDNNVKEIQKEEAGDVEKKPGGHDGANSAKEEKVSGNIKTEPKDSTDDLCELSLEDDLLLLREEEEEDFGVKLEDAEVRSVASNQSEMEFASLHDVPRELDPSAVLPLDALLAFVYFDLNFCGYLHRKDMEKILLTLGLHLCKEQVKRLVNRVVTQFVCRYRSLRYSRQEGTELGLEEEPLGNLALLCPATPVPEAPPKSPRETQSGNLVSYNGAILNVGKLLEKAEQTENGRLYLENKIHTLELKLGKYFLVALGDIPQPECLGIFAGEETQIRFSTTEASNKALTLEVQELQKRLTELEEQSKMTERQKSHFQRLLQENKKRLLPLQLEIQKIIEKTNNCLEKKDPTPISSN
ncbi:cell cycle and apoptosis regulator protein 2 isoform X1 [Varanus komodoensis]|uniref:cell cycle and apoptosis regulator protein 2 isoform X1 n=1 Tax=Varanus komodoensis TaxID=61221 RepID=UPI001CF79F76|nr:cell cycle and apoptosis regulator protein 2 isoform X1 [Varanus komodoensis]